MSKIVGWESHLNLSPSLYISAISRRPIIYGGWALKRISTSEFFNVYWVGDAANREIADNDISLNTDLLTLDEAKEMAERLEVARCEKVLVNE